MTPQCKIRDCVRIVKAPYYYCYECNLERKSSLTGRCMTCARCIRTDYKKCFSCFDKEKPQGNILRKSPKIDLRETINAPPYEPKA